MLLLQAQKYVDVASKRGQEGKNLEKVYRMICCKEMYLVAYAKLYANKGALTPGTDSTDTVDGMSIERIDAIVEKLKNRTYTWKPTRRIYILKRDGKSKRPLGMPGWEDKLVQEVIRMVLEAFYEPQFKDCSHGFRPRRGCHTALSEIKHKWSGTQWFIEGDIKGCFDNLDHELLLNILRQKVHDEDFLTLLKRMMAVGYVEDWTYHHTYSGTPQGGIVSPLLANIVLHELDRYIEDIQIPKHTRGKTRKRNARYMKMANEAVKARKEGNYTLAKALHKQYSKLPTSVYEDPDFRRLKYVRYADDFLLGYSGTREEAEHIKNEIGKFLRKEIKLEMSDTKTLITHAHTGCARFLNYEISISRNSKQRQTTMCGKRTTRRSLTGRIELKVPKDVTRTWKRRVLKGDDVIHRKELTNNSDYDIVSLYETQVQGLINYYELAQNVSRELWKLRSCYKESLIKTLAAKHHEDAAKIARKYLMTTEDGRKVIGVEIKRTGKKSLRAIFGSKPIRRKKRVEIQDEIPFFNMTRTQLIDRLMAEECELCGKIGRVQGHHIKKLKDLRKKHRKLELWEKTMIAIRRKTLFVCDDCHKKIHYGSYDGQKLA